MMFSSRIWTIQSHCHSIAVRIIGSTSINRVVPMSTIKSTLKPMIAKYDIIPCILFRIAYKKKVNLREYREQKMIGNASFDYIAREDGLILPSGELFEKPNGLSLRPIGTDLWDIIANFKGSFEIVVVPENTPIPPELVLWHEHGDHYSLQTSQLVVPEELNSRMTKFFKGMEHINKQQYFDRYPIA